MPFTEFRSFTQKQSACNKASLRPATLLKKRLLPRFFLANFAKFLRTPFLAEHLRWQLRFIGKKIFKRNINHCYFNFLPLNFEDSECSYCSYFFTNFSLVMCWKYLDECFIDKNLLYIPLTKFSKLNKIT